MDIIEIAKECGAHYYMDTFEQPCICFIPPELQQFAQRIEAPHLQRIAELEKDLHYAKQAARVEAAMCDQTRTSMKQLREALEKIADLDGNWGPFPETNKQWCAMAVVTAREALEETK